MNTKRIILMGSLLILFSTTAQGYIGPGMGAGLGAVILGIVGAIALAFIAIVWYPIKRLIGKSKKKKDEANSDDKGTDEESA
ncbi:MAG: hypothetical protein CL398_03470 [Acidiferrobacteraceae bacterium]|nr:hypothetical protein [Acidiferrobacteraceae bacterium]